MLSRADERSSLSVPELLLFLKWPFGELHDKTDFSCWGARAVSEHLMPLNGRSLLRFHDADVLFFSFKRNEDIWMGKIKTRGLSVVCFWLFLLPRVCATT